MSKHIERRRWDVDNFPFDLNDDEEMAKLHDVMPQGYWIATDHSADLDVKVALMEWVDE